MDGQRVAGFDGASRYLRGCGEGRSLCSGNETGDGESKPFARVILPPLITYVFATTLMTSHGAIPTPHDFLTYPKAARDDYR
jgi:hypothetical protein